jgi:hypothetical protein
VLPENKRIDLQSTFAQQRTLVNNDIIPSIMEKINHRIFPITNEVIYEIIHALHRHRREEYCKKNRSLAEQRLELKRKHSNSRRHDVSLFNPVPFVSSGFIIFGSIHFIQFSDYSETGFKSDVLTSKY